MILLNDILPLNVSEEFMEMYLVVIQLGAILAVVLLFWGQLWPFQKAKPYYKKDTFRMWFQIVVSCIPAVVIELAFGDVIDGMFYNSTVVAVMLILVGIVFLVVENWNRGRTPKITSIAEMTYKAALIIGLFQCIAAVFPGTSRSGATIIGALLIGVSRKVAAEYTFFLAVPVMLGASFIKLLKFGFSFTGEELAILLVGMIVSFAVSMFVIRFLMDYIRKHDFKVFGYYRIVLGIIVLLYFAFLD